MERSKTARVLRGGIGPLPDVTPIQRDAWVRNAAHELLSLVKRHYRCENVEQDEMLAVIRKAETGK